MMENVHPCVRNVKSSNLLALILQDLIFFNFCDNNSLINREIKGLRKNNSEVRLATRNVEYIFISLTLHSMI